MAYIKRLIIGAFLLLGISSAFAVTYEYYVSSPSPPATSTSASGACSIYLSANSSDHRGKSFSSVTSQGGVYDDTCILLDNDAYTYYPDRPDLWYKTKLSISRREVVESLDSSCSNSTPSGTTGYFNIVQGYVYTANSGAMYFDAKGNKYATPIPMSSFTINKPAEICSPEKCSYHISTDQTNANAFSVALPSGLQQAVVSFNYVSDGATCSPSAVENKTPVTTVNAQPPACDGSVGTINGVTTCVPSLTPTSSTPGGGSGTTGGTATGTTSGTTTGTTTGGTTTGTTTGGTTTTGTPTPSTPSTTTDTGTQSSFGGACASTSCDGDAIQCAIAQEQARRNCALFDATSDESAAYAAAKAKAGTNVLNSNPNNSTVDLSKAFDTSDALSGGHCISDVTVTVMNKAITLPFTKVCPYLQILGNILVAVSMLMAAGIMVRG